MKYTAKQYATAIQELSKEMKAGYLVSAFAVKLASDRRLKKFRSIVSALEKIEASESGGEKITVTSAKENDGKIAKKIGRAEIKTDPSLLAGIKIEQGDRRIDTSVASRLAKLKTVLVSH